MHSVVCVTAVRQAGEDQQEMVVLRNTRNGQLSEVGIKKWKGSLPHVGRHDPTLKPQGLTFPSFFIFFVGFQFSLIVHLVRIWCSGRTNRLSICAQNPQRMVRESRHDGNGKRFRKERLDSLEDRSETWLI